MKHAVAKQPDRLERSGNGVSLDEQVKLQRPAFVGAASSWAS